MEFPVEVATARASALLPTGPGLWAELKADGHRAVAWRTDTGVRLQARSGRDTTGSWPDLAHALLALAPGTVLDGEAAVEISGRLDFSAAQARGASAPARAAQLARRHPATYFCWDLLRYPDQAAGGRLVDARPLPYTTRRRLLLNVAGDLGWPVVVLPATDDTDVARAWFEDTRFRDAGFEGVVVKPGHSTYSTKGDVWVKVRYADTTDAAVLGYAGTIGRPRRLAVRLPDGRAVLTREISSALARQIAPVAYGAPLLEGLTDSGETYRRLPPGLIVEVLAGTTARHSAVDATRLR